MYHEPLKRRQFLAGVAGGVGAACFLNAKEKKPAKAPWKMRLSTSSIHFSKLPIEQACERIAKLGFEAIDIWSPHAKCPHLDDVQKRLGPSGLQELLKKHNLKSYAFSVYAGGYRKYAELIGKAGGGVAVRGSSRPVPPKELNTRMKAFLEGLKPDVELAEKYNTYIAIENHGNALLHSLDSFKAFVDNNRHPRLGIALAPYHLQGINVDIAEAIKVAGKQLFFFYAWQRSKGVKQLPGHGPVDCTPWIKALGEIKYRWYVNPFMHHEPAPDIMSKALAKSRDYLKGCYQKIQKAGGR